MDNFFREYKSNILKEGEAITFAHKKSVDSTSAHSLHLNNHIEIFFFINGNADYIVENACFSLKPGDVVLIRPNQVHKAVIKTSALYERFYILIPTNALYPLSPNPTDKLLGGTGALLSLDDNTKKQISQLLYKTEEAFLEDSTGLLPFSLITQLIYYIGGALPLTATSTAASLPPVIKDIFAFIDRRLTTIVGVSDVAEEFHLSLPYISALFKEHTGIAMNAYIRARKIAHAKKLLDAGQTVTYACYESGFGDCSYFIKCFKNQTGMTPHKYQKSKLQQA